MKFAVLIMLSDRQTTKSMKCERNVTIISNHIWPPNNELPELITEECIPVIETSVLSNLDGEKALINEISHAVELNHSKNHRSTQLQQTLKKYAHKRPDKIFDITNEVFRCSLCPFLCLKTEYLEEHKKTHFNDNLVKSATIKCPGCENIFYHIESIKSHLINDHLVTNNELNKMLSKLLIISEKDVLTAVKREDTFELKYDEKLPGLNLEDKVLDEVNSSESFNNHDVDGIMYSHLSQDNDINDKSEISPLKLSTNNIIANTGKSLFNFTKRQSPIKILDKKLYKCTFSFCKVRLQNVEKLNYHIKCHIGTSYKCPECGDIFTFWKLLISHLWRLHKIDMELFSCDKCDYKTYSSAKLNNIHKLIHSEAKNFVCNLCPKAFKNSKQLNNHKTVHKDKQDKRRFPCDVCGKTFADRRQLKMHYSSVHEKMKPFWCNTCNYKGATRNSLRMHMRQHTGEKPFACDSCSYTTSDHNSLRRHKLRHTGEMPYKCIHCDYACIQSSTYKVHLKTKHPGLEKELVYSCTECLFRTINKNNYFAHMSTVHNLKDFKVDTEII